MHPSPPSSQSLQLFDFQINGFAGVDFQRDDLSVPELQRATAALRLHGTARIFATLTTDTVDRLARRLARFELLRAADPGIAAMIAGYHLEGPWLSPEDGYRGAHPAGPMHAPTGPEFALLQAAAGGRIKLVTLAPEWPGSAGFIAGLVGGGVHVALGHTNATDAHLDDAIAAGARFCTHLGNGTPLTLPRHDNIVQRLLSRDELTACLIPDGVHLPPFVLRNFFRAKPAGKVLFTTDAMAGAAAAPGRHTLGGLAIDIGSDGIARQPGGAGFAGSTLTPGEGVRRTADFLNLSGEESIRLWSEAPAAAFGVDLEPGDVRVRRFAVDQLKVQVHMHREKAARRAAWMAAVYLREVVAIQGQARVIFACAPSQDEFLAALVDPAVSGSIPWQALTVFHMDEYVGIAGNDPRSFRHYLQRHLLSQVKVGAFHPIEADAPDLPAACTRYGAILNERPIDLVCLGIGENGHIAFNDPPVADFHDPVPVKRVQLDHACRQQQVNDGCFPDLASVPAQALTLTIPVFLHARRASIHVFGLRKAAAVRAMLRGPISPACPASIMRTHPAATLFLDEAAAS